jgi:hypothetical protein
MQDGEQSQDRVGGGLREERDFFFETLGMAG